MALKPDTLAKTIIYYNEDVYIYFVEEGLKAVHHSFICINQCLSCSRFLLNHFKSMKFHIHLFTSTIDSFFLYSTMYWDPYNPNKKRQQLYNVCMALCCYYVVIWSLVTGGYTGMSPLYTAKFSWPISDCIDGALL